MADYSKYFESGEHVAGTTYPSGLLGPKGKRGRGPGLDATALQGLQKVIAQQNATAQSGNYGGYEGRGPGAQNDLGIGVKQRAAEHRAADERAHPADLTSPGLNGINVLPDPNWDGFFQALRERGVTGVRGGPSPKGSNQLRGTSVQPDFFTGGDTFMGRPTAPTDISIARETAEGPFGKFGAGTGGQSASLLALKRTSRGRRNG